MDARVTVSPEIEQPTVDAYVAARRAAGAFDEDGFRARPMRSWRRSAIRRSSAFSCGSNERDGKPAYLKHLPRIRDYLERALAHPALAELRDFYRDGTACSEERHA